jgi:hypothetical protein
MTTATMIFHIASSVPAPLVLKASLVILLAALDVHAIPTTLAGAPQDPPGHGRQNRCLYFHCPLPRGLRGRNPCLAWSHPGRPQNRQIMFISTGHIMCYRLPFFHLTSDFRQFMLLLPHDNVILITFRCDQNRAFPRPTKSGRQLAWSDGSC